MNTSPTTEERIWAVLSHLSALAFGMGILLPVIGWSEQRRKSKYATFQCLQALGYQSLGYTVWLLAYLIGFIVVMISVMVKSFRAEQTGHPFDPTAGSTMALIYIVIFGFVVLYTLLPIMAAIACGLGRDFRYPIMGSRLAKYLGYGQTDESQWLIEEHEDRWVAAMGHFAVIIFLWGAIAPGTAWVVQGKRSLFLKFQSMQALALHVAVTILYFAGMVMFMFGFFALMVVAGIIRNAQNMTVIAIVVLIFSLLGAFTLLVIPVFHILGQWAGYRVLKGDNYKYPLIGKLIERWMTKNMSLLRTSTGR